MSFSQLDVFQQFDPQFTVKKTMKNGLAVEASWNVTHQDMALEVQNCRGSLVTLSMTMCRSLGSLANIAADVRKEMQTKMGANRESTPMKKSTHKSMQKSMKKSMQKSTKKSMKKSKH